MESKVTCVCDLCALGIPEDKLCYVGVRKCLKKGIYTMFRNREAETIKESVLYKQCEKQNQRISELEKEG